MESFLQLARTRGEERGLTDFLTELESLENAVNLESDLSDKDQGNSVQVMTAHAAKGLEFPVTIIAAMDKGTQRNSASVTFTPTFGLGLTWNDCAGKKKSSGLDDSWQLRNARRSERAGEAGGASPALRRDDQSGRAFDPFLFARQEEAFELGKNCGHDFSGRQSHPCHGAVSSHWKLPTKMLSIFPFL